MTRWLVDRFVGLPEDDAVVWHGLLWCVALYLLHYTAWSPWFIEDAAITFAYAHNAASGEGFVTYPGGEPVEGFSNPSWTLLLTVLDLFGIDPFMGSKLLGAVFGVLTLPLAWAWLDCVRPGAPRWALVAPFILALSPQFVIWNASGLENSAFNLFLAAGAVQLLREVDEDGAPISALAWAAFAITRPEAPLYAAVSGLLGFGFVTWRRGLRDAVRWGLQWNVLFLAPFLTWHAWRYWVFAWEFPNTYYAKLGETERFRPWVWDRYGWGYLRGYALSTGQGFALPVYALGQTGLPGHRGTAGILLCIAALALVLPGVDMGFDLHEGKEDANLIGVRVAYLGALLVVLPLVGLGRTGQIGRSYAWVLAAVTLFFTLYSGGDWMKGYRWLSMASVPMAVLLADGARELTEGISLPRRAERAVGPLIVGLLAAVGIGNSVWLGQHAETMPYDVWRRVQYMQVAQHKLALDHVTLLDVDMGAHMWWSGFEIVDIAGLVDVPVARHHYDSRFIDQYVFDWRNPDFAHVHGHWAKRSRIDRRPAFSNYVEIPGYSASRGSRHVGNHVRKDLFVSKEWTGPAGREAIFTQPTEDGGNRVAFRLHGWELPADEVAAGQALFLVTALQRPGPKQNVRLVAFLSTEAGVAWSADVAPGYDWYRPDEWRLNEVVYSRLELPLPADLPPGTYDLGLVMLTEGAEGAVLPARSAATSPRLARGEVRWAQAVTVVTEAEALALLDDGLAQVELLAGEDRCTDADLRWQSARRHLAHDHPRIVAARTRADHVRAGCHARAADPDDLPDAVDHIRLARRLDHHHPDVVEQGQRLADAWSARAEAVVDSNPEAAVLWWERALLGDPARSWTRRRAEEARTEWLDSFRVKKKGRKN